MEYQTAACLTRTFRPLSRRLIHNCGAKRSISSTLRLQTPSRLSNGVPAPQLAPQASSHMRLSGLDRTTTGARSFSSSIQRSAKAVINPRKDENGNDMIIEIMPRASNRLHAIAEKDSNPSLCLRVTVESGGCHGFQYLMSLTSVEDISKEEDTVFESDDGKGAKVVMDEPSLELLKGSKIDYTMELIGSQFKVTGIPGAKSSCGCGTSFDIQA
ncbi:hypothetical protein MBLNU457_4962t2 [Dothideomycetes sp. NU457]